METNLARTSELGSDGLLKNKTPNNLLFFVNTKAI